MTSKNDAILRKIRSIQHNDTKDYKKIENVLKDMIRVGIKYHRYHIRYLELGHYQWNFIWSIVYKPILALGLLYFFSQEINVFYIDENGRNFFYFIRDYRLVSIFIDMGLDINHRDYNNNTPLYYHIAMSLSDFENDISSDVFKLHDEFIKYGAKIDNE